MAKFSLKKAFAAVVDFLTPETRDIPTLSDDFAKAAFAKQGYEVQERASFKEFDTDNLYYQLPAEATYVLKKKDDDKEFIGTVTSGYIMAQDQYFCGRHHNITSIKPKA